METDADISTGAGGPAGPGFDGVYIWFGVGGLLFVLFLLAFVYLLARRHIPRLTQPLLPYLMRIDAGLARHAPRFWRVVRRRFTIRQWHGLALTTGVALFFVSGVLFALIVEGWVERGTLYLIDRRVHELLAGLGAGHVKAMRVITHYGDPETILALTVGVGIFLVRYAERWRLVELVLVSGVGGVVVLSLKVLYGRSRPGEHLVDAVGESFPSGHAFIATAFYGYLIYLTWRLVSGEVARVAVTIALTLLIVLVALSRVVLSVHWVSDVLGGVTIGLAWLVCSLLMVRFWRAERVRPDGRRRVRR